MIPVVVFIFYVLANLELIAEEIEDPFGGDDNDLSTKKRLLILKNTWRNYCSHIGVTSRRVLFNLVNINRHMVDNLSREKRCKIMRSIVSKNTKPELVVRKLLTALGYHYRLHRKDISGRPDIAFIGKRKVIFVHGCFWHAHTNCTISHIPVSEFWQLKLKKIKKEI